MGVKLPFAGSVEGKNLVFSPLIALLPYENKATTHAVQLYSLFMSWECEFSVCCHEFWRSYSLGCVWCKKKKKNRPFFLFAKKRMMQSTITITLMLNNRGYVWAITPWNSGGLCLHVRLLLRSSRRSRCDSRSLVTNTWGFTALLVLLAQLYHCVVYAALLFLYNSSLCLKTAV